MTKGVWEEGRVGFLWAWGATVSWAEGGAKQIPHLSPQGLGCSGHQRDGREMEHWPLP